MGLKLIKGKGKAPKPLQIVKIKPVPVSKPKKKTRAKKYGPKIPKKILEARRAAISNMIHDDESGILIEMEARKARGVADPLAPKKKRGRPKQYGPTRKTYESRPKKQSDDTGKKKRGRPKGSQNKTRCIITDKDLLDLNKLRIVRK